MIRPTRTRCIAPTKAPKYLQGEFTAIIIGSRPNYLMKTCGPPALFRIKNSTLIQHQVDTIRKLAPDSEIIIVTGFETDKIIKKLPENVRLIENCLYEDTNECEDLRLALNATLHDKVLIVSNKVVFNEETINEIPYKKSCVVVDSQKRISQKEISVTTVENKATIFSYGTEQPKWTQISYLIGKELAMIKRICNNRSLNKRLLFEALNDLLETKKEIQVIEPKYMDVKLISTPQDLL